MSTMTAAKSAKLETLSVVVGLPDGGTALFKIAVAPASKWDRMDADRRAQWEEIDLAELMGVPFSPLQAAITVTIRPPILASMLDRRPPSDN